MKYLLMLFVCAAITSKAFSQENDAPLRDNVRLQSEQTGNLDGAFFRWIADTGFLGEGQADLAYQGRFFDQGSEVHGVQISLETRLIGTCWRSGGLDVIAYGDTRKCRRIEDRINFLNLETVVRVNIQDEENVDVQKIKLGIVRLLFANKGITVQALSYLQRRIETSDDPSEDVRIRGVEIANFNYAAVPNIAGSDTVQLVFRVNAGIGLGGIRSTESVRSGMEQLREQAILNGTDFNHGVGMSLVSNGGLALGVAIAERVFLEGFYHLDLFAGNSGLQETDLPEKVRFFNQTVGTRLRVVANEHLAIFGRFERSFQRADFFGTPRRTQTTSVTGGIEVRWP